MREQDVRTVPTRIIHPGGTRSIDSNEKPQNLPDSEANKKNHLPRSSKDRAEDPSTRCSARARETARPELLSRKPPVLSTFVSYCHHRSSVLRIVVARAQHFLQRCDPLQRLRDPVLQECA